MSKFILIKFTLDRHICVSDIFFLSLHCKEQVYDMELRKNDIVKWISGVTTAETADVMVVTDVEGRFVRVKHVGEPECPTSMTIATDLRKVGTAGDLTVTEIMRKYKNI